MNHLDPAGIDTAPQPSAFGMEDVERSIPERFESIAQQYSDRPAVVTDSGSILYGQLSRASSLLAQHLLRRQGQISEPVAILMGKETSFYVGILGILKAGKVYIPLDPGFPEERNAQILRDAGARIMLTNSTCAEAARRIAPSGCEVLNTDDLAMTDESEPIKVSPSPDLPAYVIYTSGTTGEPKGVIQNHRNILHNSMHQTVTYKLTPNDRLSQLHSNSVMGAVRATYNAILNGATLYPFDLKANGLNSLTEWLTQNRITVFHATASLFRHFALSLPESERFSDTRLVIVGGEASTSGDFDLFRAHFPENAVFCTGLGSTETCTVRMMMLDRSNADAVGSGMLPLGYAVPDIEVHIVDEDGADVPAGETGEIMIRSRYLARGYWQKPALTESRFRPAPSAVDPLVRTYRMGDMGRLREDGCLIHAGRKDSQVKIRGFRVELGDVEATLASHPDVRGAAVVASDATSYDRRLTGYIVKRAGSRLSAHQLHHSMKKTLPDYMRPSAYVFTDALPLTANGKLDRSALPAVEPTRQSTDAPVAPPVNSRQKVLCAIWEEALDVAPVGIHDDFFDLGADSMQTVLLFSLLEKKLGCSLPYSTLLHASTIAELDRMLDTHPGPSSSDELIQIQPGSGGRPLFLLPGIGDVLDLGEVARHIDADIPLFGLQLPGTNDSLEPLSSIEDMASRFLEHVKRIQKTGPYHFAAYSVGGIIAYEMTRQLISEEESIGLLASIDTVAFKKLSVFVRPFLHLKNMATMGPRRIPDYIAYKIQQNRCGRKRVANLPPTLQKVRAATTIAWSRYELHPCPVHVTLFRSGDRRYDTRQSPDSGWGSLALDGVRIHNLPCNHIQILKGHSAKQIGKLLEGYMHASN